MKMTTEEAFVKTLQMHGIEHAFGIIGSAMMAISDLFPAAGIKFWDCAHECSGGMIADGYTRATGKMCMAIAQNGPGITNFVTPIKTAYWNHTPMLLVTPQAANKTIGQGGFQEMEQMKMFEDVVSYQEEVRDPSRIAEVLNRVIAKAWRNSAPAQINIPRDMWTQVIDIELPQIIEIERPAGGEKATSEAAELLSKAKFPVILNGAGGWQVHASDEGELVFHHQLGERRVRHRLEPALARTVEARKLAEALHKLDGLFDQECILARKDQEIRVDGPVSLVESVLQLGRKGLSIQRYKGLGEMNPDQLWETTLDPEIRSLIQVRVEHADQADDIFTTLMGDLVEPRREFIQENALKVVNLDI